ncbi:MAG: hypothetical protein VX938_03115, partial [Myxococcota bacterium]|nr:hypothetical protein [Myxococcota bacterium]
EAGVGCKSADINCDDGDACTVDLCDPDTGCSTVSKCAAAEDLVPCMVATCDDGVCGTGPAPDGESCVPNSVCTDKGTCEEGKCVPLEGELSCDDDNVCTTDVCDDTQGCVHEESTCNDGDPCTLDSCDPTEGCLVAPKCDEDLQGDCKVPSCDPDSGTCGSASAPEGTVCESNDVCFAAGSCGAGGLCLGSGDSIDCDDDDPCTKDTCDAELGCQHETNLDLSCDDGNPCTEDDACGANGCAGAVVDCDDGDDCTQDACIDTGACVNEQIPGCGVDGVFCDGVAGSSCDDEDPDTLNDICLQGICRGFERVLLAADNGSDTDLVLTRVDRAHDTWFVAAEHGGSVGEVFGLGGYTEEDVELFLYENLSPQGQPDLGRITGLHNGFAATEDGLLVEFVPGDDGGSWSSDKPISAAFGDDALDDVGCLWASGPSGSSGTAVWVGGRSSSDARVHFCH